MKISDIEIARQLETAIPDAPAENETQAVLRRALELLGPNGEHWFQGTYCNDTRDKFCILGVVRVAAGYSPLDNSSQMSRQLDGVFDALIAAAGTNRPEQFNDTAECFAPVRAMLERAITLAAS